jgi:hypothetical protein
MKVYVVRDNNRDYCCDDIRVYADREAAELAARHMIVEDLIESDKDLVEFADRVNEWKEVVGNDRMAAIDLAIVDTLGGRCFVTEVEVRE